MFCAANVSRYTVFKVHVDTLCEMHACNAPVHSESSVCA